MKENEGLKIEDIIAKIKALKIPTIETSDTSKSALIEITADTEEAFVVGNSLVSFAHGVSVQNKEDVINSTLIVELAAAAEYPRESERFQWYDFYYESLNYFGWDNHTSEFKRVELADDTFYLDAETDKVIKEIDEVGAYITRKTISAIENSEVELEYFSRRSMPEHQASFQLCSCKEEDGVLVMLSSAFILTADTHTDRFFWRKWVTADSELLQQAVQIEFSSSKYAPLREIVLEALENHVQNNVFAIDI
jgi:hypothetical protein